MFHDSVQAGGRVNVAAPKTIRWDRCCTSACRQEKTSSCSLQPAQSDSLLLCATSPCSQGHWLRVAVPNPGLQAPKQGHCAAQR